MMVSALRCLALVVLASLVCAAAFAIAPSSAARAAPPDAPVSWLSTGDSYASGEGITGTGAGVDVCARSRLASGPLAADLLRFTRGWTIAPELFSACTAARLVNFDDAMQSTGKSLWQMTLDQGPPGDLRFDVITVSLGGNDIDFSKVVQDCIGVPQNWGDLAELTPVGPSCDVRADALRERIDGLRPQLESLYTRLASNHLTSRGRLVVLGYPRLVAPSGEWAAWRGNRCSMVSRADADMLGDVAEYLDEQTVEAVEAANAHASGKIELVSRLNLFDRGDGHTLCAKGSTWLNGLTLGRGTLRPQHGFHPNELGHAATAEVVAARLDAALSLSDEPASSLPEVPETTAPPITTGRTYEPGDEFEASCVVAWPTAPVRYRDHIEMRMSCSGVPSQFLFVDVAYGDPDLPVTPSTGSMRVRGEIADIARSELGFTTLIVIADDVDL